MLRAALTSAWQGHIVPFGSASGEVWGGVCVGVLGACVCERQKLPLTEKMSSPNSMNPILSVLNIFREHLALCVFSDPLFLHHSHALGGNIGLNSLSLTPTLLV